MKRMARVSFFAIVATLAIVGFSTNSQWKDSKFIIRFVGAIAGAGFLVETSPLLLKREAENTSEARVLVAERENLKMEREQIQDEWKILESQAKNAQELAEIQIKDAEEFFKQEWQQREAELAAEIELLAQQNQQLATINSELNAIKYPAGTERVQWVAKQLIDALLEFDLPCDYSDSHAFPGGVDLIWLRPRGKVLIKKIRDIAEELQLRLALESVPEFTIEDGVLRCEIKSNPSATKRQNSSKTQLIEPPKSWFRQAIEESNHYFINGDTGSGKSTLVANLIEYVVSNIPGVIVIVIDPKYPDSQWTIGGKEFTPQYRGYFRLVDSTGKEHPDSMDGIRSMHSEVRQRLADAGAAKIAGNPAPNRPPIFYIIDEAESLIGEFGSEASEAIKDVLRVGRSTQVKCLLIGQNPGCRDYNLQKANLRNASCFYLRENTFKGIDECASTTALKTELRQQTALYQQRSQTDSNYRFYGLVKYPGRPPFLAKMPEPNYFATLNSTPIQPTKTDSIYDLVEAAESEDIWG